MTFVEPTPTALTLLNLIDCVCTELAASGAGPTCWCGLYPGAQVSWEGCGECNTGACGMGYVRLIGGFPYDVFPTPTIDDRCAKPLAFALEVGALRCLPHGDGLLDPAATAETVIDQMADARALYNAIKCCPGPRLGVQNYIPVGPQGGCVGGYWTAYAPLDGLV